MARIIGIMEQIELAGVHSGDRNAVLPYFDLSEKVNPLPMILDSSSRQGVPATAKSTLSNPRSRQPDQCSHSGLLSLAI